MSKLAKALCALLLVSVFAYVFYPESIFLAPAFVVAAIILKLANRHLRLDGIGEELLTIALVFSILAFVIPLVDLVALAAAAVFGTFMFRERK